MDLSALNSSLPQGLADAERDMGEKFRAAALSITTLYKSSLACNKQAYQVGYSAALADVLSKLQSDIAAGEDAAAALARLMDWTEARQAAMAVFADDDDEAVPASTTASRPSAIRNDRIERNIAPPRPASAPVPDRVRGFGKERETSVPGPSSLRNEAMDADEAPAASSSRRPASATVAAPPAPERLASESLPPSSPIASPSISRPFAPPPLRLRATPRPPPATVPTSTFNFSIPTTLEIPPTSGPSQTGPIGAKRPIVDAEMSDATPSTPSRGPRAAKRRSMGIALDEDKERGSGERRRPPRRGGGLGP